MAKSLEAGKLIIGAIAISVDPTGTAAATLGIDTVLQIKNWFGGHPDIAKLAKELDKAFTAKLAEKHFDKPTEARTLLPQMLETVALNKDQIAECDLDADLVFEQLKVAVKKRHTDYDNEPLLSAFEDLVLPLLKAACDDPRLEAAIRPALTRRQLKLAQAQQEQLVRLVAESKETARKLHIEEGLLIALARNYGQQANDFESARTGLQQALEMASQEQARDALPSNLGQAVDDIVAKVKALNDADKMDEADALLIAEMDRRDAERERQIAEDTRIIDKAIAQAIYRADATALAERILRRIKLDAPSTTDQFHKLRSEFVNYYQKGLRFGSPFDLTAAIGIARKCQLIAPSPLLSAIAQNDGGTALQNQGTRIDGAAVTTLLAEAVTAYRDALFVFTREDHPVNWAMTTQNLATALQDKGTRTDGPDGTALLAEAVTAYRDALTVSTREDHPVDWAETTQNLANALQTQGTRTDGPAGTALLAEAVTAYRDALTVCTREDHPVRWAMTTQNLANALANQGTRTDGPAGTALLAEAVTAYRDALTVYTHEDHSVQWAMTQANIALAERATAQHPATADPEPHWIAALKHVDLALEVYDPIHLPYNHIKATKLRAAILARE